MSAVPDSNVRREGPPRPGYAGAPECCVICDQIEQLDINERFRVVSAVGTFEMTRGDFERVFDNVARSKSYRLHGMYHYPVVPAKADPFRVG